MSEQENSVQRTPDGLLVAMDPFFTEGDALRACSLACAIADAYAALENASVGLETDRAKFRLGGLLRQLEAATAFSELRQKRL